MTAFPPLEWVAHIPRPYAKDTNHRLQEFLQVFNSSKLKKVTATLESHVWLLQHFHLRFAVSDSSRLFDSSSVKGSIINLNLKKIILRKSERMKV